MQLKDDIKKDIETFIKKFTLFIVFLSTSCLSFSQTIKNKGIPFITNFTPEEYKAQEQNWAIFQDKRGIMYFGNNQGILEYDGNSWNLIELTNHDVALSFAEDEKGKIYVSGTDELGYLQSNSAGKMIYISLLSKLSKDDRNVKDVWAVYYHDKAVVFQTYKKLFIYKDDKFTIIKSPKRFHRSFLLNKKLFIREDGKGLVELSNNTLVLIPDGEKFTKTKITAMLPFSGNKILISSGIEGAFVYDGKSIREWKSPINEYLKKNQVFCGKIIGEKYFAFGTILNGIILIDTTGKAIQLLNKENGLQNNTVYDLFVDKHKNLWAASDIGISYIEINSPFSIYDIRQGFEAKCYTSLLHKGNLFIGGARYLYKKEWSDYENPFEKKSMTKIESTLGQQWQIKCIDNEILCANKTDVFLIEENNTRKISINNLPTYNMTEVSYKNEKMLLLGQDNGFSVLKKNGKEWIFRNKISGFDGAVLSLVKDSNNVFWLYSYAKGIYKLSFNNEYEKITLLKFYETGNFFPQVFSSPVNKINHQIIVAGSSGFLFYNDKTDSFESYEPFNRLLAKKKAVIITGTDSKGNVWFSSEDGIGLFIKKSNNNYTLLQKPFARLGKPINAYPVFSFDDSLVIFGQNKYFIHYEPTYKKDYNQMFYTLIRKVKLTNQDSVIYSGANISDAEKKPVPSIDFKYNSIRFEYSASFYENSRNTEYTYKLEGSENDWSAYTKEIQKDYTNLPEGRYVFCVKARNIYQTEGNEARFEFEITPPWYRKWWAWLLYGFFLISSIYSIVYFNGKRLKAANLRLEALVKQRTEDILKAKKEIEIQKEGLQELNVLLKQKNEEVISQRNEIELQRDNLQLLNSELSQKKEEITIQRDNLEMLYTELAIQKEKIAGQRDEIEAELKETLVKSEVLKREKIQYQFEAFKNQVNPHFLFNNFSTLTNLIAEDAQLAEKYLLELSNVYRYILAAGNNHLQELSKELKFIDSYMFLVAIRFNNSINLSVKIDKELYDYFIPLLSLQLLVENAIKHNVISSKKQLFITIETENDYLIIKNNLQKKNTVENSTKTGLTNIMNRYKLLTDKPVLIVPTNEEFIVKIPVLKNNTIL